MKIARSSVQNALASGLFPVLLLVLVTAVPAIGQRTTNNLNTSGGSTSPTVQQVTLSGSDREVTATTTSGSLTVVTATFTEFSMPKGTVPQLMASASDGPSGSDTAAAISAALATLRPV